MSSISKINVNGTSYDVKDAYSVSSELSFDYFDTLDDFVTATDGTVSIRNRGHSFPFRDTGGWGPLGYANTWYRCLIVRYQNTAGGSFNVGGHVILGHDAGGLYYGFINGTTTFSVEWTSLRDTNARIFSALPSNAGILNGHFGAYTNGGACMISHVNNDITQQYRLLMGANGYLNHSRSTDGGSTWTSVGNYVRTDQSTAWEARSTTLTSGYFSSDSWIHIRYNPYINLAAAAVHLQVTTKPANGTTIATGLPKPPTVFYLGLVQTGSGVGTVRTYINTSGNLLVAGTVSATGWFSGTVTYPYSSLS